MLTHVREAVVYGELAESAREAVQTLAQKVALYVYTSGVVEA
jgi:hypothetical protein